MGAQVPDPPTEISMARMDRRPFFTSRGLANYLALSERTVRELLRTGDIPSYKVSGSRRIDPADVDSWLADCREERRAAS